MHFETISDITVVTPLQTHLERENHLTFKVSLAALPPTTPKILLDLKNIQYIDTTGLGTLLAIFKQYKQSNRSITLCNLNHNVHLLLDLLKITPAIPAYPTRQDAEKALIPAPPLFP